MSSITVVLVGGVVLAAIVGAAPARALPPQAAIASSVATSRRSGSDVSWLLGSACIAAAISRCLEYCSLFVSVVIPKAAGALA